MKMHHVAIAVHLFLQEKAVRSIDRKVEFNRFGSIRETNATHVEYLMSIFSTLDGCVKKMHV